MSMRRADGPTPAGGDYSEIYFLDKDMNPVTEKQATHVVIRECKSDGTLVQETFMER